MTETDVAILLALANGHDQRQGVDDVKVQAWHALFQQEAPDMTREWGTAQINRHYAESTDMLMPAHLVTAWRRYAASQRIDAIVANLDCVHGTPSGPRYCALCRYQVTDGVAAWV